MGTKDKSLKVVWFLTVMFFVYQFVLRLTPGALYEEIMINYGIDNTTFAILSGVYYLGYAGMQVPIGILLDKFGVRYVVPICAVICCIGNLTLIETDSWQLALVGRFFVGLGSAAGALGAIKAVRITFPHKDVSKMIGWSVTFALIGAINGKKLNSMLFEAFGWNNTVIILSLTALIVAILVYKLAASEHVETEEEYTENSVFNILLQVLCKPEIVLAAIFGALLVGPLEAYADVWGSPFFVEVYGFTKDQAAYLSSASVYFGMCVGSPVLAWIADKYQNHRFLVALCGAIMGVVFIIFLSGIIGNYYLLLILNLVLGFACAYQVIIFAYVVNIVSPSLSGMAVSFVNMINMAAGFLFNYAFGKLVDLLIQSSPEIIIGDTYKSAMYVLPITLFAGTVGFLAMISCRNKNKKGLLAYNK